MTEFDLQPLVMGDAAAGGATDAQHLFGFGRKLGTPYFPTVKAGLHWTLHHILDRGGKGCFPMVLKSLIPVLEHQQGLFCGTMASYDHTVCSCAVPLTIFLCTAPCTNSGIGGW